MYNSVHLSLNYSLIRSLFYLPVYPSTHPSIYSYHLLFQRTTHLPTTRAQLKELSALSRLNAVLKHTGVVVSIERARAVGFSGYGTIQRIEAVALEASPEPKCADAERAGTECPEETADWRGNEST